MTGWRELEAKVDRRMAQTFGERVRVAFFLNGAIDQAQPAIEITAILHCGGDDSFALGTGYRTRLSASKAELVIDRSTYTGPMIKTKDKVRALERAGQPWFEVAAVSSKYSNLLVLSLAAT
ncbi:MAG: hypothetical protein HC829_02165 [Bacteroidales bacterium]|nr:hypothetical protein [Bacteroidales bacterium]